ESILARSSAFRVIRWSFSAARASWQSRRSSVQAAGPSPCASSRTASLSRGAVLARTPWAPGAPVLAAAALAVEAVARRGQSVEAALATTAPNRRGSPGESAVRAVTYGTLRWYLRLAPAIEELLERPSTVAGAIQALL